jgi:hypothetical protein
MRTRLLLIIVLQLAVVFFSGDAEAQTVTKSTLSGTLMSASATLTAPGPVAVFTTPEAGFFVLTEFCSNVGMGLTFSGSTFGIIVIAAGSSPCTTYVPGIALPQAETLTCSGAFPFPGAACMISGVLSVE